MIPARTLLASKQSLLAPQGSRGFATGKQIKQRMHSVASIGKITQAMKMVSASKLRSVQANLEVSRKFAAGPTAAWPLPEKTTPAQKVLFIPFTSDRGLCGAVNSTIVRQIRAAVVEADAERKEVTIAIMGDKGRASLERKFVDYFTVCLSEIGKKKAATFADASVAAQELLKLNFDEIVFTYNKFKNAISYTTTALRVPSYQKAVTEGSSEFWGVMMGPPAVGNKQQILRDLYEFRVAAMVYQMLCEAATSEQSSRMNAMESSAKNAREMLSKLSLSYNKARQAKITGELMEIVGGVTAMESADGELN